AEGRGDRVAVRAGGVTYTFDDLRRLSNRAGHAFRALGVARGDRVLLRLGTSLDALVAFLGAVKIGAVVMPTSPLLRETELRTIVKNSEAALAVVRADLAAPVEALRREGWRGRLLLTEEARAAGCSPSLLEGGGDELEAVATGAAEPAFMMYTSGTTGEPKGVVHAHRWIVATGDPVARVMLGLRADDVCFQPQDWSFIYALGCNFLYPFHAGAAIVLPGARFDAPEAARAIAEHRVTVFCAVPTIYRMMLAQLTASDGPRLASLRCAVSAGEPLPVDTFREWRERFGVTIYDGLGQSESHIFMANRVGAPVKPGSMGRPLPGYEVAVLDDEGKARATGEPGHLVIRNDHPGLSLGYYRDAGRWAEVNRDGWYYTKDFAYADADGDYWYVSRSDDLIKSRAYLISPKEVESALMEHPAVLEAGVIGVADPVIGQKIHAVVTLKAGLDGSEALAEEIKAHTRSVLAPYKTPHEVEFVTELPKTLTGKVLRRRLREHAGPAGRERDR
ncbi:MAG TPA: AMP-binding protein, partial [Candidatus Limnocylindria bacterium]|nr:AMP-binding protein [Candidatus Limnocylindria bacterium]